MKLLGIVEAVVFRAVCRSGHPTNSIKALKEQLISTKQCYLHLTVVLLYVAKI